MKIVPFDPLADEKNLTLFIDVPFQIEQPGLTVLLPLKAAIKEELSLANPFFTHADSQAFLAWEGERVVGRLLASIDRNLVQPADSKIGHIGYFACIDKVDVAKRLFFAAENWLKTRGVTAVHGPVNLNMMVYYRLQTSGFDTTPFLGEPRNPAYYPLLFDAAGYSPGPGWRSYDLSPEQLQIIYQDLSQKISRVPSHVTARPVDPSNLAAELAEFYPVALQTYSNNYGFSAISEAELAYYFEPLAKLLPHGIMLKAYSEGLFGYAFGFWDLAPLFQKAHGDVGAVEHSGEFIPSRLLAHTIGILPEQQKTGAAYLLLEEFFKYAVASKRPAIGCLAKDGPSLYDKCAKPSRTYHMFLKQI